ncbi:hypothetical protein ACHAXA_006751 [Cyclostephanos tholiformis]|uniref:Uncharacterized protein n=1 Tax=Cyclostephanos tholiformis TaxID=382380 RepID=A0ABD3SRF6_9STRA
MTAWKESKDAGQKAFSENKFYEALHHYSTAIDQLSSSSSSSEEDVRRRDEGSRVVGGGRVASDHQILLSNVVACRLKIGGSDMVEKAVDEAKKCVSLNNKWSKAHVRLASAYIALGGHSNDACLSLQRALSLDKTNTVARDMLVKEMRRRNNRERCGESGGVDSTATNEGRQGGGGNGTPSSSQGNGGAHQRPTDETPRRSSPAQSVPPHPSESINDQYYYDGIDVDDINPPDTYHSMSISQRVRHHLGRILTWYHSQSEDTQTLLKVACCLLILYLALGGRFGLDYALGGGVKRQRHRGNYGEGNAYNRYSSSRSSSSSTSNRYSSYGSSHYQDTHDNDRQYDDKQQRTRTNEYRDRTKPQNDRYYSRGNNDDYYEPRGRRMDGNKFRMPSMYDPTLVYMAILLIGGMVCHRFGVNPFQILMMLNLLRRGGGARFGYGAYQGFGRGFGFGRQRYGFGRRDFAASSSSTINVEYFLLPSHLTAK